MIQNVIIKIGNSIIIGYLNGKDYLLNIFIL